MKAAIGIKFEMFHARDEDAHSPHRPTKFTKTLFSLPDWDVKMAPFSFRLSNETN